MSSLSVPHFLILLLIAAMHGSCGGTLQPSGGQKDSGSGDATRNNADEGKCELTPAALAANDPTYHTEIKPMLSAKCTWCHSSTAPSANRETPYFETYDSAKSRASKIFEQMNKGDMPPKDATPALAAGDATLFRQWMLSAYTMGSEPLLPEAPAPGTNETVGYDPIIKSILDRNCVSCHTGSTPKAVDLQTYALVNVQGPAILAAVKVQKSMPPGSPLSAAEISYIQLWADDGYLENGTMTSIPPDLDNQNKQEKNNCPSLH